MDQNGEQEVEEEEAAEASEQPSSQPVQSDSQSEADNALAEAEEKDIETTENAEEALRKINALQNKLRANGPFHWPPQNDRDKSAVSVYIDNTPKPGERSSDNQPDQPSVGATHDAAPGRVFPGGAAAVDVAVTGGK